MVCHCYFAPQAVGLHYSASSGFLFSEHDSPQTNKNMRCATDSSKLEKHMEQWKSHFWLSVHVFGWLMGAAGISKIPSRLTSTNLRTIWLYKTLEKPVSWFGADLGWVGVDLGWVGVDLGLTWDLSWVLTGEIDISLMYYKYHALFSEVVKEHLRRSIRSHLCSRSVLAQESFAGPEQEAFQPLHAIISPWVFLVLQKIAVLSSTAWPCCLPRVARAGRLPGLCLGKMSKADNCPKEGSNNNFNSYVQTGAASSRRSKVSGRIMQMTILANQSSTYL